MCLLHSMHALDSHYKICPAHLSTRCRQFCMHAHVCIQATYQSNQQTDLYRIYAVPRKPLSLNDPKVHELVNQNLQYYPFAYFRGSIYFALLILCHNILSELFLHGYMQPAQAVWISMKDIFIYFWVTI